jgi:hypothetical protein
MNRILRSSALACLGVVLGLAPREVSAQIEWRVSVKFIVDANGNRPTGGIIDTDQDVLDQIDAANRLVTPFSRGYTFQLTEIRNLTGFASLFTADRETVKATLQSVVVTNPASILWRNNALNVYINAADGINEGITGIYLVAMGHNVGRETFTHESGHYLGLCHTHGCDCESCTDCVDPSDGIADTLPDSLCWSNQNQMATNYYHSNFVELTHAQQVAVSNTFNNIMGYHALRKVYTSDQLDHITDVSNTTRSNLVTGFTRFVDRDNTCTQRTGSSACVNNTGGPFQTVAGGINNANAGDIVLIRQGHYNEPTTIRKAITLRATRGDALIGTP